MVGERSWEQGEQIVSSLINHGKEVSFDLKWEDNGRFRAEE